MRRELGRGEEEEAPLRRELGGGEGAPGVPPDGSVREATELKRGS